MKLDRYDGEVPIFSEDYEGRERTIFGSATESNNINDQFTPEFMRGWGIVGDTEFPTLQDFNALGFTHGKLISYLYQAGIPSYTANEKYYPGSIVQYNNDIYLCTATEPTSLPTNTRDWVKWQSSLGKLAQIRADKNGFLLNKAGTYNALIDTDLVQATGQSQTKIMTQKAVTDFVSESTPVGIIQAYIGENAPNNKWLLCRGQTFSAESYPALAQLLPNLKIPDLRGVALRGLDANRGFDPNRKLLSYQEDAMQRMTGLYRPLLENNPTGLVLGLSYGDGVFSPQVSTSGTGIRIPSNLETAKGSNFPYNLNFDNNKVARTSNENRMKNVAVNFIIKAR